MPLHKKMGECNREENGASRESCRGSVCGRKRLQSLEMTFITPVNFYVGVKSLNKGFMVQGWGSNSEEPCKQSRARTGVFEKNTHEVRGEKRGRGNTMKLI